VIVLVATYEKPDLHCLEFGAGNLNFTTRARDSNALGNETMEA
jgi:hypothetical protein